MAPKESLYEERLRQIVRGSVWFTEILEAVRECDPPDWFVGGGVIRNLVWNGLHGYAETSYTKDVDVVFFDAEDLRSEREQEIERGLCASRPDVPWDAKNQAAVHLWYEQKFGYAVLPLRSSEEGIEANPETATSVGVRLLANGDLHIAAPLGLSDLFELTLRRNPRRAAPELFYKRLVQKGVRERWPKVRVTDSNICSEVL